MREILFRGKRKDNGEWVYGYYAKVGGYCYILTGKIELEQGHMCFERHLVISETVGQYTGLTDKNGTKIFEGDVLRVNYSDFVGNWAEWKVFLTDMTDFPMMERINTANEIEVIGNIHE